MATGWITMEIHSLYKGDTVLLLRTYSRVSLFCIGEIVEDLRHYLQYFKLYIKLFKLNCY
jgi:hypothetical protein